MNKKITVFALFASVVCLSLFAGLHVYSMGYKSGFIGALNEVSKIPALDFHWKENVDGTYTLNVYAGANFYTSALVKLDVLTVHSRNGEIIDMQHSAGTVTNIGKDYIEDQVSDSPSATLIAKYISCDDTDSSGLSATSTQLTSELAANGFTRAAGTYASTGTGTWTVSKTFTSSGTQAVQTYGLQWDTTGNNNLLGYDISSVKNTVSGDTLAVTFTLTIT
jgi:hypothetical protein